jgi:tetratricopeptide (TPR) repeat protein
MKKFVLILLSVIYINSILAQNQKVQSALNYWKWNELVKAKEAIDAATKHEKTMNVAKTWWYNGLIYQSINDSCIYGKGKSSRFCDIEPNAADIALNSYIKAVDLNFIDPKWHQLDPINKNADKMVFFNLLSPNSKAIEDPEMVAKIFFQFPSLANVFATKGYQKYQSKVQSDIEKSVDYFEKSLFLSSTFGNFDTTVVYLRALAAEKLNKYDDAIKYYKELIVVLDSIKGSNKTLIPTYMTPNVLYYGIAINYRNNKDTLNYVNILKQGVEKFPSESDDLMRELINHYLSTKQTQEAMIYLNVAIEKTPNNYTYHYNKGAIYDQMNRDWKNLPVNNLRKGMKKDEVIKLFGKPLEVKAVEEKTGTTKKQPAKGKQMPQKPQVSTEILMYQNITIELENGTVKSWNEKIPTQKPTIDYEAEALKSYLKSVELKPDYFDAQFNIGVLYYNKAVEHFGVANDIPPEQVQQYENEVSLANEQLKLALPYFEKAHQLNSKDLDTVRSLKEIYTRLKMYENANEMKELLEKK